MKKLLILLLFFSYSVQGQIADSLQADTTGGPDSLRTDSLIIDGAAADTLPGDSPVIDSSLADSLVTDSLPAGNLPGDTIPAGLDSAGLATDTVPERIEGVTNQIRNMEKIILVPPGTPVEPGFMRADTAYGKVEDLMPLPFEGETELTYEEEWPVTLPDLTMERKEPVWLYPQYFWRKGIITGFNFSQASFTNWAAGGENNLNLITFASIYFRKSTLRYEWENLIDAAYGVQSFQGLDVIRKSEDKLEFTSKIGHKTTETLFTSFLFNFKTQFDIGYNYHGDNERDKVSNFLAPAYVTTSLGLDYKPSKAFSLLLSPIAGKITLVMDQELADQGRFGVDKAVLDTAGNVIEPGKNSRSQLGMGLNARLSKGLGKNITFNSKLDMFGDYEKPTSIDISWDNSIIFRVNNAISANLSTALIYDEDILIKKDGEDVGKPRIQFKEIFSLGVRFDI
ncbi:DUF3078 family protein [Anseongella ginsenosidimutans]|uniref:DUF3078 family protein n=1 Tax=Anseongella ginsenosidimutans TaxID=496056 RepID=A0A4R3KQ59_9SPHI|nr:DUF3078 domain-containing protein [Anseongella ginsenosidimutans]QEC53674.1 DUF3078 domain-containing protein [Anseongella ginsenosidimutans]TCS86076.1 DUF3078 family protein [Anseongella ginsenosidimutans]